MCSLSQSKQAQSDRSWHLIAQLTMNFDSSIIVHLTIDSYDAEKGFSPLLKGIILVGVIIFIEGNIGLACNSSTQFEF